MSLSPLEQIATEIAANVRNAGEAEATVVVMSMIHDAYWQGYRDKERHSGDLSSGLLAALRSSRPYRAHYGQRGLEDDARLAAAYAAGRGTAT